MTAWRLVATGGGLLLLWQAVVFATGVPDFLLPGPTDVFRAWVDRYDVIAYHASVTLLEILLGLSIGVAVGGLAALAMSYFRPAQRWLMPILVISQAIPVFALAPLLVLWLGYGMGSKVAMAALIIFFPVTSAFSDGLRRTERGWIDLAHTMGGSRLSTLCRIRLPAALPAFASGVRVAAAVAPIGAVVGEWVGSSAGLGYLMLQANARVQTDFMFAALLTLAVMALTLFFAVDAALKRAIPWQPQTDAHQARKI